MCATALLIGLQAFRACSGYDVFDGMDHMKQEIQYIKKASPHPSVTHEVILAVKQLNLNRLNDELMARSTPNSAKYQKWLSFDEVGGITSNRAGAHAVIEYLNNHQIKIEGITPHHTYIRASAPVSVWESLLQAKFYTYEDRNKDSHSQSPNVYIRTPRYSLPKEISPHVVHIFNTVQLPTITENRKKSIKLNTRTRRAATSQSVTISFLNALYSIPSNQGSSSLTQSVFQTSNQYFSPTDLKTFQQTFGLTVQAAQTIGGFETSSCSTTSDSGNQCNEANLDTQYIMGIAQNTKTQVSHVDGSSMDPFLAWILDVSSTSNPPSVNSISWTSDEQSVSSSVMDSFNTEAQKLGAMGVTILACSGDNGVTGNGCTAGCDTTQTPSSTNCVCDLSTNSDPNIWSGPNSWSGTGYIPKFPATSPYVTVIGGTAGPELGSPEVTGQSDHNNGFTSGGGFSTYFAQPSWQTSAVSNYFSTLSNSPSNGYNNQGRGYPDVSLIAVDYSVILQGAPVGMSGTSASAPLFAGMISLVNAARQANGKGTVGFINPTLYQAGSSMFNDITSGDNHCCNNFNNPNVAPYCCNSGFTTTTGWDPVTGFGSITHQPNIACSVYFSEFITYASSKYFYPFKWQLSSSPLMSMHLRETVEEVAIANNIPMHSTSF